MYKAVILPLANEDIKKAAHWYNHKQEGLGKRFTQEVRSKIIKICENPRMIAVRFDKTRCAILSNFPFMIHYSIHEKQKTIVVAAVFHTSLNPDRWENR